jgi:hypothetical protein
VAWSRVNYQAGWLVDDGEVLVLKDERQRNCGRANRTRCLVLRKLNRYPLTFGEEPGCSGGLSFDRDELVGHEPCRLSPGKSHLVSEEPVQPLGLGAQDRELYFVMAGTAG